MELGAHMVDRFFIDPDGTLEKVCEKLDSLLEADRSAKAVAENAAVEMVEPGGGTSDPGAPTSPNIGNPDIGAAGELLSDEKAPQLLQSANEALSASNPAHTAANGKKKSFSEPVAAQAGGAAELNNASQVGAPAEATEVANVYVEPA